MAQTVTPASSKIDFIGPQPAQTEQTTVARTDTDSDSTTADVTASPVFSSSTAAVSAPLIRSISSVKPPSYAKSRPFLTSRLNRTLIATEFSTRGLDAYSTHRGLNNPCNCYHEESHIFGLNLGPMLKTNAGAYSYSLGVATIYSFVSAKLWNASQNHPRHARLLRALSRDLLIGDSSMEGAVDVSNFSAMAPVTANP